MNKRRISWLAAAIALPALVFSALASTAFAEPGINPARAEELIAIALLDDSVMDGSNWTTTKNKWSDDEAVPDNAACKNSIGKLNALEKSLASGRVARGKNTMTQLAEPGETELEVSAEITVYKTAAPLEAAFKDIRTIYASGDIEKCLAFATSTTGQKVTPYIPAKAGDPAAAFAAELKTSQLVSPVRFEHYSFYEGNTLTQITISGPKPLVDQFTVEFLVGLQVMSIDIVSGY